MDIMPRSGAALSDGLLTPPEESRTVAAFPRTEMHTDIKLRLIYKTKI